MDSHQAKEIAAASAKTLQRLKQGEQQGQQRQGQRGPNSLKSRREKERKKSYKQKEKFLMFTRFVRLSLHIFCPGQTQLSCNDKPQGTDEVSRAPRSGYAHQSEGAD